MAPSQPAQEYVEFHANTLVPERAGHTLTEADIESVLFALLQPYWPGLKPHDYEIADVPVVTFHPPNPAADKPPFAAQEVFSVSFPTEGLAAQFRTAVQASISSGSPLRSIGVNPTLTTSEFSVPVAPDGALFGTLDDARRLIRADRLPANLNGEMVNVVVIDAGIDRNMLPAGRYGGGWHPKSSDPTLPSPPLPGMTTGTDALHGRMIVNNILAMAPRVTIFDVPLIPPPKIFNIFKFLHAAHAAYARILTDILWFRRNGFFPGPWIFMNAWAIFDRRSEGKHLGEYTENLGPSGIPPHHFIRMIERVAKNNFDIVFCAGNCGEVCPDDRCGPNDYGPGRGIWGANAHRNVLTAAAVRVDAMWPGYSSEGPGPTPNLYAQKPDLCAPSQFVGASGQYPPNTGTSASSAIAAGIVSALRSRPNWNQTTVSPLVLNLILKTTARQTQGLGWNRWLGNGILDALAASQQLEANFP